MSKRTAYAVERIAAADTSLTQEQLEAIATVLETLRREDQEADDASDFG